MTENKINTLNENELELVCGGTVLYKGSRFPTIQVQQPISNGDSSDAGSMFLNPTDTDPRHPRLL
jgi:hypothetical protein